MFNSEKLAELVTHYCLNVSEGSKIGIQGNPVATPLIQQLYKHVLLMDGQPELRVDMDGWDELLYAHAKPHQLRYASPFLLYFAQNIDGFVQIRSETNVKRLTNVPDEKRRERQEGLKEIMEAYDRLVTPGKLSIIPYPTLSYAQEAEMSLFEYEEFVEKACFLDKKDPVEEWRNISKMQEPIVQRLNKVETVRFVGDDTDLKVNVKSRTWINCDGHINMPDGEVFTGPIENSANGQIRFTYPGLYMGKEIEDIFLTFKDGQVTNAKAEKGQNFLDQLLKIEGTDRIGEVAVGINNGITRFTKNMLFDEKMAYCMHLALGRSIPLSGGQNKSTIHWDLLKDMRSGEIYADGELVYEKGRFVI